MRQSMVESEVFTFDHLEAKIVKTCNEINEKSDQREKSNYFTLRRQQTPLYPI
jgi:hypothetical protein